MPAFSGQARRSRQLHILAGSMYSIAPEQLRMFISAHENDENTDDSNVDKKRRVLVLDCRSFVAYNNGHILDAVNVHCPAILRRRCGGRLPLRTIIPNSNIRSLLLNNQCYPVVLYDDYGQNIKNLNDLTGDESTVAFIAKCLRMEADLKTIYYLEGGYQTFACLYPESITPAVPTPSPAASPCPSPRKTCSEGGFSPVEILPHLYLGCAKDAGMRDPLQQLGVTALMNVTPLCPNLFLESFQYKSIPVRDTGMDDIAQYFHDAIRFIDQVKAQNGKVLVHCQAGISRSATICIAYLMATKRLRMEEAYKYVKSRRRIVSPNFNFMGQLLNFENQIFSSTGPRYHLSSPGSPLLAVVASTPDPDSLTPSRGASQRNVFDFLPIAADSPIPSTLSSEKDFVSTSIVDTCHKLTLSPCAT